VRKGDGVTDDTTAIQNYASSFAGKISAYFPAGDYFLSPLSAFIDKHTYVEGEGEEVTNFLSSRTIIKHLHSLTAMQELMHSR
jgi:hypothetical protein